MKPDCNLLANALKRCRNRKKRKKRKIKTKSQKNDHIKFNFHNSLIF